MLTSEMIKEAALAAGADMCGIGSMDRFEGAPREMDPRYIFPEAKSIIGMVFRIPRGVQQGIEQGTQFYQYPSMAYGGINEIFAPAVLYHVGKLIEDHGYEAAVYRNTGARGLRAIMENAMLDPMFSLPDRASGERYYVTRDMIEGKTPILPEPQEARSTSISASAAKSKTVFFIYIDLPYH